MWVREGHRWGGMPSPAVAEEGRGGGSSLWLGRVAGLVSGSKQSHLLSGPGGISDGVQAACPRGMMALQLQLPPAV